MIADTQVARALEAWLLAISGDEGGFPREYAEDPPALAREYDRNGNDNDRWPPAFELAVRPAPLSVIDPGSTPELELDQRDYRLFKAGWSVVLAPSGGLMGLAENEVRYLAKLGSNKIAFATSRDKALDSTPESEGGRGGTADTIALTGTADDDDGNRAHVKVARGGIFWQTATAGPVFNDFEGLTEATAPASAGLPNPQRPRLETAFVGIEPQQLGLKAGGVNRRRWLFQVTAVADAEGVNPPHDLGAQYMCLALLDPVIRRFAAGATLIDTADGRVYVRKRTHLGPALTIESEYRLPATVHLQAFAA